MGSSITKYRTAAAVLLVVLLTGYSTAGHLRQRLAVYPMLPARDPVTFHEERIRQLLPALPKAGEVGYVTTVGNDRIFSGEKALENVEYLAQYVLTQYTLAPLFVRNSPDFPLVVGNFLAGPPPPGFLERHGLEPLTDYGEGLFLYRKAGGR